MISDIHLQASQPATAAAWTRYLDALDSDALFILGDLFEVWVGDDTLTAPPSPDTTFLQTVCDTLARCARQRPVYVMHGNRDFLLHQGFYHRTGTQPLPDPTVLVWGQHRWLMTHGDGWCLDDHAYMAFRSQVRTTDWSTAFLSQALDQRLAWAREARARSTATKTAGTQAYADVDTHTALKRLQACAGQTLVHGHTHRPAEHTLAAGLQRLVLPDWEATTTPPRGGGLRLHRDGRWERTALPA